jgi:hypothetical protein
MRPTKGTHNVIGGDSHKVQNDQQRTSTVRGRTIKKKTKEDQTTNDENNRKQLGEIEMAFHEIKILYLTRPSKEMNMK